ncbi:exodeoxyribonuclease III [Aquiluna sp.]|nr:exodeoxyribonuclease III [Aquiluna sp.]MDA7761490.1 exodeoxyribonuclease III [Aquiluna sp.]MDA9010373.1 exodeoxyribonuclease III [Aquiluna sp.]MDA9099614.1 exodeoxyribonuclease III [Aquiluna sp.]MDB4018680.1 exodeoxyribonuclease III [Aquiluna sp.]
MQIATWNVNSVRARQERVTAFLQRTNVDVLAMQEIKCKPEQFPVAAFESIGYKIISHGLNQWNGVAFAYKQDLEAEDIETSFDQQPEFKDVQEARALGATFNGVRVWSLYVPNGRGLDDPHMQYKLEFLDRLAATTAEQLEMDPGLEIALVGDFNVAPLDTDVYDLSMFETHVSSPEREAFEAFEQIGLTDKLRELVPGEYTYWDYKDLCFPKNNGMRIDFVLTSEALTDRVRSASIEREERKGELPSDHVPVVIEISS